MATPEYLEEVYGQSLPYVNPEPSRIPQSPEIEQPVKKPRILTKKEMMTITMIGVSMVILIFANLMTQVTISNQNRHLQDLQTNNAVVSVENNNLSQEVQELSRYNRIMEIAEELGLEMNEANVRNVTK